MTFDPENFSGQLFTITLSQNNGPPNSYAVSAKRLSDEFKTNATLQVGANFMPQQPQEDNPHVTASLTLKGRKIIENLEGVESVALQSNSATSQAQPASPAAE